MTGPDRAPLPHSTQVLILLRRSTTPLTPGVIATWLGSHVQMIYYVMRGLRKHGYVTTAPTDGHPRYLLTEAGIRRADEIRYQIRKLFTGDLP